MKVKRLKIIFVALFLLYCQNIYSLENFEKLKRVYKYDHSLPLNSEISKPVERGSYYEYKIYYDSLNKERVPALLLIPKVTELNKKIGPPWPVIFVMHFHGSDKTLANMVAENFVKFGIALFSIDGVYKGERAKPGKDPLTPDPEESIKNLKQQIFDILRGVDFLQTQNQIDKNRIGFLGISLGAITGAVATSVDERFKYVALADGAADFYTLFRYSDGAYESSILKIREYLLEKKYTPEKLREIYKEVDPLYFVGHISPRPLLLQNGKRDTTMSLQAIKILHQVARQPKKIIWYESDHILPFDLVALDCLRFFYSNFTGEKIKNQFSWIEEEKIKGILTDNINSVEKLKKLGINTIFYDVSEKNIIEDLKNDFRLFVVIKYAAKQNLKNIKDFSRYTPLSSGYPSSSTVCPASLSYWKKNIIEKSLKLLNKNITGILIDLEMDTDKKYYRTECICDECFSRYLEKIKSKEDIKNIPVYKRREFLAKNNYLLDYRKEQKKRVSQLVNSFIRQAQKINPDLIFGFLGYENGWFYQSILEGFSKANTPVLVILNSTRETGISRNVLSLNRRLKEENENFILIPGFSLEYFLAEEIPPLLAKATSEFSGYCLTFKELEEDYLEKIKFGKKKLPDLIYCGKEEFLPKVAIVYSAFNNYAYREVYHQALEEFEVPFDEYENTNFSSLVYNLKNYDAVLTTPFWNSVNTVDLSIYRGEIMEFLKDGGIFSVFDANSENNIFYLSKIDKKFSLKLEKCSGKTKILKKHQIFEKTNRIENLDCGSFHFVDFHPGWEVLAKCVDEKPFLLIQNVGGGVISVASSVVPSPELMENFWEYLKEIRAGVILESVDMPQVKFGENKIYLKISNRRGDGKKIRIIYGTLKERFEKVIDLKENEEKELTLSYILKNAGKHRFYLIISDLEGKEIYVRKVWNINVVNILKITTDKSFYTEEEKMRVFVEVGEEEKFLKGKKIFVKLKEKTLEIPARKFSEVLFDISDLEYGKFSVGAELFGKNRIASANIEIFKLKPVKGMAKINYAKESILEVDDSPFFPIGIYSIPEKELKELKETGFNCTVNYNTSPSASLSYLNAAEEAGIKVIPYAIYPQTEVEEKDEKELEKFLDARKTHPALLAWYLVDEPELNNQSPELIDKLNKFVKEKDPYHPTTLVIAASERYRDYGECSDIFMIDPYPIPGGELEGKIESVYLSAKKAKNNILGETPLWCIPQAFDWAVWQGKFKKGDRERPTPEELRNMTYQAIVGGAKGIIYWAYRASRYYIRDYPATWEGLKKVVAELNYLTPVLLSSEFKGNISVNSNWIKTLAKEYNNKLYLFSVNLTRKEKKVKFSTTFLKNSEANVVFENRKVFLKNGEFEDIFKPIEVHIYEISLN